MDFAGANHTDTNAKIDWLKSSNWIDQFTKAVAVKWTIFNQWDRHFYSMQMLCESPGLGIRRCSTTLQDVTFLERSFNATVTDEG